MVGSKQNILANTTETSKEEMQLEFGIKQAIAFLQKYGYTVQKKQPEEMTVEEIVNIKNRNYESAKRWRERNKERIAEYQRQYRKEHPEKCKISTEKNREYSRRYRETHREKIREYSRKWYAENKDKVYESKRKWRLANPDYAKKQYWKQKRAWEKAVKERNAMIRKQIREAKARRREQEINGK